MCGKLNIKTSSTQTELADSVKEKKQQEHVSALKNIEVL